MNDYILKSACWLSGFALIYIIFLKNERFFELKRIYLLAGLILSCILPLVTLHHTIELAAPNLQTDSWTGSILESSYEEPAIYKPAINLSAILIILYLTGIGVLLARLIWHLIVVTNAIRKSRNGIKGSPRIIRAGSFKSSFSFFSYVLINTPVEGNDLNAILNHELVHVRQKHWIDLVLAETIRIIQWMNPFSWIYVSLIRKNHEYLADAGALRNSTHPSLYKAALLNQMFRAPLFSMSNSFSYSINRTRFEMMKSKVTSPYRKLKAFLILPVSAFILYAFSEPVYVQAPPLDIPEGTVITAMIADSSGQVQKRDVYGSIISDDGKAIPSASIAVTGSTIRTRADEKGNFKVAGMPENSYLLFSARGFETQVLKPVFGTEMTIKLDKDPKYVPEPEMQSGYPAPSLIVVDGKITEGNMTDVTRSIPADNISRITVLRGEDAVKKYGEKARDGVLEVTTKQSVASDTVRKPSGEVPFVVVEEMPMYPGGDQALLESIARNTRYPENARLNGIEGRVIARFVVSATGKVEDVMVLKGVDPELDNEAVRVVSMLDNFVPGKQGGRPVPVYYMVPITFALPLLTEESRATLLKHFASNIIYPEGARANSITGTVPVRVKTEKGGTVKEVAVADANSRLTRLPEVVVIGYKGEKEGTAQGGLNLLETEVMRVANTIGATGIPELMQKDLEFIIPVKFVLKDK